MQVKHNRPLFSAISGWLKFIGLFLIVFLIMLTSCAQESDTTQNSVSKYRFNPHIDYALEPTVFPPYTPDSLVKLAESFIKTPYKENGRQPGGFDCSGFTFYLHKQFGIYLPSASADMAKLGIEIAPGDVQKGDLIFFKGENKNDDHAGHVGIIVSRPGEPVKFIHSSSSRGIRYDFLDSNPYFKPRFIFVKRIVESPDGK